MVCHVVVYVSVLSYINEGLHALVIFLVLSFFLSSRTVCGEYSFFFLYSRFNT